MESTAFIFDDVSISPVRQIGIHSHVQWELSYVIHGRGIRTVGNTTEPIVEGEIILIPPNIPHVWHFDIEGTDDNGHVANISVFFAAETLEKMSMYIPEFTNVFKRISVLTSAIRYPDDTSHRIAEILLGMRGEGALTRLPKMMELLIEIANTSHCKSVGKKLAFNRISQRIENVRVYCRCNYARKISLDEISEEIGMNKSSFCTFMRHHFGMSLTEFVNAIRLEKAKEMLCDTDIPVASIAYDVGFSNVTYFNRLFKKKYNCNPKMMRDKRGRSCLNNFVSNPEGDKTQSN